VVLLLTAALVAPYFIDWANYRADFERQAGIILGRDVRVEGSARARLLPFPSVTFSDVVVAGTTPDEPAMTIEEFSMDAELAPFLSGEVLIFDMRLVRPRANIRIDDEGRVDWAMRPSSPFDPQQVSLERLTVTDGSITVHRGANQRSIVLSDINSELSARSLAGPWRVQGQLKVDGLPMRVSGSTGTGSAEGIRIRVSAQPEGLPFALDVDGQASVSEGKAQYAGNFDLRSFADVQTNAENPAPPVVANRVTGKFNLSHQRLGIDEFRLVSGTAEDPYTADGHAELAFGIDPSFSIVADGAQLRWEGSADQADKSLITAGERIAAFANFVSGLPKPTIPGTVSVNLPAIVAGDTTIRDIKVQAEPVAEGWSISSVAATLPGRTRFEGKGLLAVGDEVSFAGKMLLAISQPSGFAMWVARDVDDAIRRLPAAGFSADVTLSATQQAFENLELILGEARFGGRLERQSPADRRASILVSLDGGRLDVDGLRAFASLFIDEQGQNRVADHDVDVEFAAGPVVSRGIEAERIETELRLREQVLEIDRFSATGLAGANVSATGRIETLSANPAGSVDATIVAVDLAPFVSLLAQNLPDVRPIQLLARNASLYPGLLEEGKVDILAGRSVDGSSNLTVKGVAGGTDFTLNGSAQDLALGADTPIELQLTARNAEPANLYALVGLPGLPLGFAGDATLEASLSGKLADGAATTVTFKGEDLAATFNGTVARDEDQFNSRGEVELRSGDLEPWLSAAGIALPGFGYGLPAEIRASIDVGEKLAVISDVTGQIAGSSLHGDLNAEMRNSIPHVTGELHLGTLDLALAVEMVTGSEALQPGEGTWPEASLQRQPSMPFTADVDLTTERLWLGDWTAAESANMQLRLDTERLALSNVSGTLFGGRVKGLTELRNDQGTGLLSAQFELEEVPLLKLLPESGLSGSANVNATVSATGKSVNALVVALSGSGSATLKDIAISGLNPQAFKLLLEKADELGPEVDASHIEAFAPDVIRNGKFEAGSAELAFTVANGVARFPPLQLANEGARMSVEGSANFRDRSVSASGSLTFEPGIDAVAGADPTVRFSLSGPLGEVASTLDTEPLAQFLTQRALEREQDRVEHMQAVLLETQRLRREQRYYEQQAAIRAAEEAERIRIEREAERSRKAAEEARRQREEAERRAAEEKRKAAEAARQAAEEKRRLEVQKQMEREQQQIPQIRIPPQGLVAPVTPSPAGGGSNSMLNYNSGETQGTRRLTPDENRRRLFELFNSR